jgi:hypothetical protein
MKVRLLAAVGLGVLPFAHRLPGNSPSLAEEDRAALHALLSGGAEGRSPPAAPAATTATRHSRLWLDLAYQIEAPSEAWFEAREDPRAWRDWYRQVALQPTFVDAFTGADWAGDIVPHDFEAPPLDGLTWDGQRAGVPVVDWGLDDKTRAVLTTGQTVHWAPDAADLPPPAVRENWFYPERSGRDGDETAPVLARFVGWVAPLPAWEGTPDAHDESTPRAVALPLDAGATLLLAQAPDLDLESAANWRALRAQMQPQWVELQVPSFRGWQESDSMAGGRVIEPEGFMAVEGGIHIVNRSPTHSRFDETGCTLETLAMVEIALPKPPSPPGSTAGSDSVISNPLPIPYWNFRAPPLDLVLNRPFRWALFDAGERLLATGAVSAALDVGKATGTVPKGWLESLWFGWTWQIDRWTDWLIEGQPVESGISPWRYHAEHGWIWLREPRAAGMWYWDAALHAWSWASAESYPWLYWDGRGWAYFGYRAGNTRWFYLAGQADWIAVAD